MSLSTSDFSEKKLWTNCMGPDFSAMSPSFRRQVLFRAEGASVSQHRSAEVMRIYLGIQLVPSS